MRGESSDPATQKALNCITKVKDGKFYATANDVVFRNPNAFGAGEIHHHYDTWDRISQGYHRAHLRECPKLALWHSLGD